MTPQFNEWWDSDKLMDENPYLAGTPIWWAWEGWAASAKNKREACEASPATVGLGAEFEAELRSMINRAYEDVRGTESYERKRLLGEIDRLRAALRDIHDNPDGARVKAAAALTPNKALAEMEKEKARRDAELYFQPGKLQDEKAKQLADKYYAQYVTPPGCGG